MTTKQIIESGVYTLIDVRESSELELDGKIDNALHIPLGEIPDYIDQIAKMTKPIVIFCRSGNRSGRAIEYLENEGLNEFHNGGGYNDLSEIINP